MLPAPLKPPAHIILRHMMPTDLHPQRHAPNRLIARANEDVVQQKTIPLPSFASRIIATYVFPPSVDSMAKPALFAWP